MKNLKTLMLLFIILLKEKLCIEVETLDDRIINMDTISKLKKKEITNLNEKEYYNRIVDK